MILPRNKLSRLERINETKTSRGPGLADMINAAAAHEPTAEIRAVKPLATAAPKPRIVKAKAKPPERVRPKSPPPAPPQWWEEMLGWRGRGAPDPRVFDDVRYETIHEYDPMEWALKELDYDLDE